MAFLIIFVIVLISFAQFSLLFVLFINKFVQDPKKRKNVIIRYIFITVFMILGLVAGVLSHS